MRRLEEAYRDRVDFHILNIDQISTHALALRYGVAAIPHIVLLDADGNQVADFVGYLTEEQLVAAVERLVDTGG